MLLLKDANHHLNLQQVIIFLLVEDLALIADQDGGCWSSMCIWQFLKIRQQWSLQHQMTLPFKNNFSSMQCCLIALYPQLNFFKNWSQSSQTTALSTILVCVCVYVSRSVVSDSCDPMDYSPPGSFVHGILQARILEWVAISFSRGFSQPRDGTWVYWIAGSFFPIWATRKTIFVL